MVKSRTAGMKILSVILGTLMGGFLFRCRGESGFGSSWGLYSVGLVLILLIYVFYGRRKGMKYELIPLGAFLTGLGVTGYATVLEQLSGQLMSDTDFFFDDMPVYHYFFPSNDVVIQAYPEYDAELAFAPISLKSAFIILMVMGFTLFPFFAFFIGTLFSKKEYKIQHYAIAVVIFFAVSTVVKATIAHPILKAINPEQVNYALLSLKDRGYDYSTMFQAYMSNFLDRPWTQQFQFVENYYMSIEHISDVFGILSIIVYAAARKDAFTGIVTFIINMFMSVVTPFLSLLTVAMYDTGVFANIPCPRSIANGEGWSVWEFSTGAAVGFITLLIIALLPKKHTEQSTPDSEPWFKNNIASFAYNFIATVFIFGVVPFRVLGIRANKLVSNMGIIEEGELYGTIACVIASIAFGVFMIKLFKQNILVLGDTPFRINPVEFSSKALTPYLLMCCFAYFFLNHGYVFVLPYSKMTGIKEALYQLTESTYFSIFLMVVTFMLIAALYFPMKKKILKDK